MIMPFLIGIGLTLGFVSTSVFFGLHKERGAYPVTLIAIALFYIVFAFEHGSPSAIILNITIASLFIGSAVLGYVRGLYIVAFALIGHGAFDIIYQMVGNSPAPDWWAPLCLAADLILGGFLIYFLKTSKLLNR